MFALSRPVGSQSTSLGDLMRRGVRLDPADAAAIVVQLCRTETASYAPQRAALLDSVTLDENGRVERFAAPSSEAQRLDQAALVLRGLLPDPGARGDTPAAEALRRIARRVIAAGSSPAYSNLDDFRSDVQAFAPEDPLHAVRAIVVRSRHVASDDEERPALPVVEVPVNEPLPWDLPGTSSHAGRDAADEDARWWSVAVLANEPIEAPAAEPREATGQAANGAEPAGELEPDAGKLRGELPVLPGEAGSGVLRLNPFGVKSAPPLDLDLARPPAELEEAQAQPSRGPGRTWLVAGALAAAATLALFLAGIGAPAARDNTSTELDVQPAGYSREAPKVPEEPAGPAAGDEPTVTSAEPSTSASEDAREPAGNGDAAPPGSQSVASATLPDLAAASPEPADARSTASAAVPNEQRDAAPAAAPRLHPLDVSIVPAFSPSFSPAGREVYFHAGYRGPSRLMRAGLTSGAGPDVWRILDDGARNYHPRVSPDGRFVAFDSDRDGTRRVYLLDLNEHTLRRVTGAGHAAAPSWSPDGRSLVVVRAEPKRPSVSNLWEVDLASGLERRLTSHQVGQTWSASWFPDGRRIAYSHEDRLIVLDLVSGDATVHRSPEPGALIRTPAVSPDGQRIVFQVRGHGVWLLDVATGRSQRLLRDRTAEEFAWSPDGSRIAFHSRRDGSWRIWILDSVA